MGGLIDDVHGILADARIRLDAVSPDRQVAVTYREARAMLDIIEAACNALQYLSEQTATRDEMGELLEAWVSASRRGLP